MKKEELYQNFPENPGIYIMRDSQGGILYVGKAGNLKRRVSSYFQKAHDSRIEKLVSRIHSIEYEEMGTAIEALIREAELIKKYEPPFNVREKDDKSFLYVEITKEKFPRVLLVRGKSVASGKRYGPFTSATAIRDAMKIIRKIFPFATHPTPEWVLNGEPMPPRTRACFDYQIGLCPGTCIGAISVSEYRGIITNMKLFLDGKKKRVATNMERDMKSAAKAQEFEKAESIKRRLFALQHIQDVALLGENEIQDPDEKIKMRIEGYDISNISGDSAVGSMVVFIGEKPDKNEYRKFKIKTISQANDTGMLREVLMRRFAHSREGGLPAAVRQTGTKEGWAFPDVILIDGGLPQVNAAKGVLLALGLRLPIIGIAKGPDRKKNEFFGSPPKGITEQTLIKVRDEAHRFAVKYHRELRGRKTME
ncbi:MAG: GIY-YIG nuclease family protein [Patescibacteria group bacterium]